MLEITMAVTDKTVEWENIIFVRAYEHSCKKGYKIYALRNVHKERTVFHF